MSNPVQDMADKVLAAIDSMRGTYALAISYIAIATADGEYDNEGNLVIDEDTAIELWQNALARKYPSNKAIAAADKQSATIHALQDSGLASGPEWDAIFADLATLDDAIAEARVQAKKRASQGILSPESSQSEKVWRDCVDFATFWHIVPQTRKPFSYTARGRKNNALIAVAQSVGFTKDPDDKLAVLEAMSPHDLFIAKPDNK